MFKSMFVSFLTGIRKFLFRSPKPLPPYDPQDLIEENKLLDFINQERIRNGLLPLEEFHDLSIVAKESARINYQYNDCTNKPYGLLLEIRLMKQEYSTDLCAELVNRGGKSFEECFYSWSMKPESAGVLRNGYFCHVGIGKCGHFWTAVFARPRIF